MADNKYANFTPDWHPIGVISKYKNEGTSKNGPWLRTSIRYYNGKDKSELKFIDVSFFAPSDQIQEIKNLEPGTKIQLHGWPEFSNYKNKDGNIVAAASCRLDRNSRIEIISAPKQQETLDLEEFSDEPF